MSDERLRHVARTAILVGQSHADGETSRAAFDAEMRRLSDMLDDIAPTPGIVAYAIGTPVPVGPPGDRAKGVVTGVTIRGEDAVTYEVAWWAGRSRNTAWLSDYEFQPDGEPEMAQIGFKP